MPMNTLFATPETRGIVCMSRCFVFCFVVLLDDFFLKAKRISKGVLNFITL